MKTTTLKNFAGLTYLTITKVPVKKSDVGEILDVLPRELESLASMALIQNKVPVRGAEFRVFKSAIGLSNEAISERLGISRNTVLKWGKELDKRLNQPYEMLIRLMVAELLNVELETSIEGLKAKDSVKKISIKAA